MNKFKNTSNTVDILNSIILSHRDVLFDPPINKHVVFVMSGGLDSTIGVARIIEDWNCYVHPLFIRRHARATKYEEQAFDSISNNFKKRYKNNFLKGKKIDVEVPPLTFKTGLKNRRLQNIGHAMRNAVLQSVGVQYSAWLNDNNHFKIRTVFAANVGDDFLPHSSIQAYRTQTILVCTDQNDWSWQIASPFTEPTLKGRPLFKVDNIKWANLHNLPLNFTRTCINDCQLSDGTCGECVDRLKAFKKAGFIDPIKYNIKK